MQTIEEKCGVHTLNVCRRFIGSLVLYFGRFPHEMNSHIVLSDASRAKFACACNVLPLAT